LHVCDPRARSLLGYEKALGHELLVCLDDDATAHPEVVGKVPAGRQADAPGQPAGPDGRPQFRADLVCQAAGRPVDPQMQLRQVVLDFVR
jgi:hypothetical protein